MPYRFEIRYLAGSNAEREAALTEQHEKIRDLRQSLKSKKQELQRAKCQFQDMKQRGAVDETLRAEYKNRRIQAKQMISELQEQLRDARGRVEDRPPTGSLPNFVVIGAQKGGTTYFYDLLSHHPHVRPAVSKEIHYFDARFDKGIGWYRRRFPPPVWKDGRKTITGEATPYYLFHPFVAERMAESVPGARLIALLRNPVDRAYSHYHHEVRKGREPLSFEEALEAEQERLRGEREKMLEDEHYVSRVHREFSYLSRGLYLDQVLRFSKYFDSEQVLVLKSEDFFGHPEKTLRCVLAFLDLPDWEPQSWTDLDRGAYAPMNLSTKRRLLEYFEPHNQRLYEYLGMDFGW